VKCPGGGECNKNDLQRILKDIAERPLSGSITRMCRLLEIDKDRARTINTDDAWEYFYELLEKFAGTMSREQLCESLASYLLPAQIEEHLNYVSQLKRKTA
jgi:hypothetical protein